MIIETKYNIGDEVWVMYNNKPTCLTILEIKTRTYTRYQYTQANSERGRLII